MSSLIQMLFLTAVAGSCILAGGLLARFERIRPQWLETEFRHSVIAFGGGVLVSAVALVLVPEGNAQLKSPFWSCLAFLAGGAAFCLLEITLHRHGGEKPQFSAMLLDYLPESLALGGLFATGSSAAPLLALLIGMQNLPEGFNTYRELTAKNRRATRRTLLLMASLILLGPLFGLLGWKFGGEHPALLGSVMLFAAGGILYLLFQDIAPQARLRQRWAPTLGAVLGFALGLLGELLVNR
jgi:ZIP family zinc transporter